ncbi:MAG: M23 family metallopeptidase [Spirochaetes bacterium]|nr:M23 family metallopeptidase [Spirochaetota bacterium]
MKKSPFLSGFIVTQTWGENPASYQVFGLRGHEGVDLVPVQPTWGVHAIEGGTVIEDDDNRTATYGNHVRVRSPSGRVWIYAHLSENVVLLGQDLVAGQLLGIMGNTGRSSGAHLHLSVYRVASDGRKIEPDNGYAGTTNPMAEDI